MDTSSGPVRYVQFLTQTQIQLSDIILTTVALTDIWAVVY